MKVVNQHSILHSVYEALTPSASLIDGRTEQDWLRFLSDFAALINFYDQDNLVNGNWEPFILKDPVFLMAAIAGTSFTKLYTLYLHTCRKLEQLLSINSHKKDLAISFNQLFDQLISIFIKIRQWFHYMQQSVTSYPLKTYIDRQIRATFANELQAILALRQELFSCKLIVGILPVDPLIAEKFDGYQERIWKEGEFKGQYWELMGLLHPIKENTQVAIFTALTHVGEALFNFLQVIITQAHTEFDRLKKLKSSFPDTTLLRTFVQLLKVQQAQLNQIGDKHLSFYYRNILRQTERKAVADRAYLVASLAAKDVTFNLPAGTLFDAGIDAQKNPIVFESTEEVVLNPAAIPMAYTLSRAPAPNGLSFLQLQTIPNPGVVQKDVDGKILCWDTLGNYEPDLAAQQTLGIAFASPMLLLREGTRIIKFSLTYTGAPDLNMLREAQCYLSTLNDWLAVNADFELEETTTAQLITITLTLQSTDPPIECFLVNPDGIESSWPMFKLVFKQVTVATIAPPVLHAMKIEVNVSDMETFQLYNDYGALSTKVAYPLFGPSPADGSNFIMGSNEIFSKPVNSLTMQLNWAALPPDFSNYYQAYNLYLNNQLKISKTPSSSWWQKIFGHKKKTQPVMEQETEPYNNACFVVDFQVLDQKNWTPVVFDTLALPSSDPTSSATVPSTTVDLSTEAVPDEDSNLLFTTDDTKLTTLSSYTSTAIPLTACDPALQYQPMKFTETSTAGFIKMELKGPAYGFGSAVYPNVVSAVTLYNSQILYTKEDVPFVDPAQLPFTPKLKSFSAAYSAAVQYVFDAESQEIATIADYPIQAFLYTPFTNYVVYDNLNQLPVQKYTIGDLGSTGSDVKGIPLYASYAFDGFLYLAIDSLVPASSFNIYFELARKYVIGNPTVAQVNYYYLGTEGWAPMVVLTDGTDNLTSSGIITLNVPANITLESELMPNGCYWMAIVANDISLVAATVLLSTNGVSVQRADPNGVDTDAVPIIAANTITKTKKNIPKIGIIQQPFPSFGGRAAEDTKAMNWRVSNRLKTKDRAVTAADYVTLIKQEFSDIYDAVAIYDLAQKTTNVYVVKAVDSWTAPHAFLPMVSIGEEKQLQLFLQQRTSAFSVVKVLNPDFQSVTVYAVITIQAGYEFSAVQQNLIQALNIYLSPWIKDPGIRVEIYQDLTDVQVAAFIKTISGVAAVERVSFKTWMYDPLIPEAAQTAILQPIVKPIKKSALFISNLVHQISLNTSVV